MNSHDMKIEAVLFDFGGVIAEEGFKQGLTVIAQESGLDEKIMIQVAFDIIYSTGYVLGKAPEMVFWNALRQETGIRRNDASLRDEIFSRFILRDWMIDLVKKLKANKIKVGILSDQTDMLDKLDKKYDFFRWFDHVFNSYHMGKGKRDPGLFDDIAQAIKTKPDRIVFIDDDAGNVERAKQKGWQGMLYVDRDSFEKDIEAILLQKSN